MKTRKAINPHCGREVKDCSMPIQHKHASMNTELDVKPPVATERKVNEVKHSPTPWVVMDDFIVADRRIAKLEYSDSRAYADAAYIVRAVNSHEELLEAVRSLTKEIHLNKLNIRKDFSLMNAHACATKAIAKAEGK